MREIAAPVALVALISLGAIGSGSEATTPGKNGLIAPARHRYQDSPLWSEIYVIRPDGRGMREISHSSTAVRDQGPQWSPDGRVDHLHALPRETLLGLAGHARRKRATQAPTRLLVVELRRVSHQSFAPDGRHVVMERSSSGEWSAE